MHDDQFARFGIMWQRRWVGDNSGRYEWTSDCGRMRAWRSNRAYLAAIDGYVTSAPQRTLVAAMDAAWRAINVKLEAA